MQARLKSHKVRALPLKLKNVSTSTFENDVPAPVDATASSTASASTSSTTNVAHVLHRLEVATNFDFDKVRGGRRVVLSVFFESHMRKHIYIYIYI